jgi:thiol-disulfide isomerase/thioredoxin
MKFLIFLILLLLSSNQLYGKELLIVGADWCVYCVKMQKYIENNPDIVKNYTVEYINIDEYPDLKDSLKIESYPTSFIFDDNKQILDKLKGFEPNKFNRWIKKYE